MMVLQNAALTAPTTSYANTDGSGDRTSSVSRFASAGITAYIVGTGSTLGNSLDGGFTANNADSINFTGALAFVDGDYFRWQFSSLRYIDEIKLYNDRALSSDWGTWKAQVSNDGSTWTDLNSFTWNQQTQAQAITGMDPEGYLYFQILKVGATASPTLTYFEEVEFKIADGAT